MKSILCLVLLSFLAFCGMAGAQDAALPKVTVDIEPQPLRSALSLFADQTGLQVLYRDEDVLIEGLMAPRVTGELSTQDALSRVLAGTNLKYEFVNDRIVRIMGSRSSAAGSTGQQIALD